LFATAREVTASSYIETDPAFTNYKKWLSSDYYLEQLNYDPDKLAKRLGDGFYEQKLIKDQVMSLTGGRYLGSYASDEEEYRSLMNNALEFVKGSDARIGVALTAAQQASLTKDIVWMVEKSVLLPDGRVVKASGTPGLRG
jgi:filamentous hemagglutinin